MSQDAALFQEYLANPTENRSSRWAVAAAAVRVLRAGGAQSQTLRGALSALAADSQGAADALPHLVDAAAVAGASTVDVAAFAASSLAWKAVVAAVLQSSSDDFCPADLRKRVLFEAAAAASSVLDDMCSVLAGSRQSHEEPGVLAGRFLKIIRFHSVNLARCAKRFLEQGTELVPVDACVSGVVRNFAAILRECTLVERGNGESACSAELEKHALVPAAAAVRVVLLMCGSAERACEAVQTALGDCRSIPTSAVAGRLLVVVYLLRLADADSLPDSSASLSLKENPGTAADPRVDFNGDHAAVTSESRSQPPGTLKSEPQTSSETSSAMTTKLGKLLRMCVATTLIPLALEYLRHLHISIFMYHSRLGRHSLISIVSSAVCEASASLCRQREFSTAVDDICVSLVEALAGRDVVVSHVASDALLRIASQCNRRSQGLFRTVLSILRLAWGADNSSVDTRWLSIASVMCERMCAEGRMSPRLLFGGPKTNGSASLVSEGPVLEDSVALRVVAGACRIALDREGGVSIDHVLDALQLSKETLAKFCKSTLMGSACAGRIAEACVILLPFVCDGRAASGAALACMKRATSTLRVVIAAVETLNPSSMPDASLRAVSVELPRTVHRHGIQICPAVLSFVRRALAQNSNMEGFLASYSAAVEACLHCAVSATSTIAVTATFHHAGEIKRMTDSPLLFKSSFEIAEPHLSMAEEAVRDSQVDGPLFLKIKARETTANEQEVELTRTGPPEAIPNGNKVVQDMSSNLVALTRAVLLATRKIEGQPQGGFSLGVANEVDALMAVAPALASLSSKSKR